MQQEASMQYDTQVKDDSYSPTDYQGKNYRHTTLLSKSSMLES
jgi:hypothetical protein